jgi:hypothetical protein
MRAVLGVGRLAMTVAVVLAMAAPTWAQAQAGPTAAMDDQWHFNLVPYMWMTGIEGDVSVAGLRAVPVEASFSDIWDNFDFGLAGRFEGRKNRFGFGLDFTYNNLGAPVASNAPVVGALGLEADVRQLFGEGFAFFRVAHGGRADNPAHLDLLAGARYTDTRTRLTAQTSAGVQYDGRFQDLDWLDAMAGLKGRAPLGSRAAVLGRADVAGFGSNLTWNVEGDLAFMASRHWTVGAGWRYMDIDYDNDGEGVEFRQFQLAYNGPRVWFAYSW